MSKGLETNGRFSLELAEDTASIACSHCEKQLMSVCGFISRDGDAYSTYFALLHTGHDEIVALLTISVGKWWDEEALNERHWIALTRRGTASAYLKAVGIVVRLPRFWGKRIPAKPANGQFE